MKLRDHCRTWLVLFLALPLLGACASQPATYAEEPDPWVGLNRGIYAFNDFLDRAALRPVSRAYKTVVPTQGRRGVRNFFDNLREPLNAVAGLLQGKPRVTGTATSRFVLNTTIGMLGLFDVATQTEVRFLRRHSEDFGQTFAVWGVPAGPYLMLPLLGPSSARDAAGLVVDWFFNPLRYVVERKWRIRLTALNIVDARSRLLKLDETIQRSQDPYVFIRTAYIQRREFLIYDGDPPVEDEFEDEFDDEWEDDEDWDEEEEDD